MPNSDVNFGVALILPQCAFRIELPRENMAERLKDIDDQLTEQGVPDDDDTRFEIMVENARAISLLISTRKSEDKTVGIADIAYSFVYALGKKIGVETLETLRGLSGSFLRDTLRMNPCLGEIDFQQESAFFSKKMEDHDDDDEWDFDISNPPTFH